MSESFTCWICGGTETRIWKGSGAPRRLQPDDLRITDSRYGLTLPLRQCAECGFVFAEQVDHRELVSLYSQLEDTDYLASLEARNLQMNWLLEKAIAAAPAAKSLLDIGAGAGYLVQAGQRRGLLADGIEPSAASVAAGRRLYGVDLVHGAFPDVRSPRSEYDLVFLVDVIEHVADPVGLLRACREVLSPAGTLVVVTPDVRSLAARAFGSRWWHYRLAHVGYFDRRTLGLAARRAGLTANRFFRARWCFQVRYLCQRLARYLPVARLNGWAEKFFVTRALYDRIVPLNLFDSWVVLLTPVAETVT